MSHCRLCVRATKDNGWLTATLPCLCCLHCLDMWHLSVKTSELRLAGLVARHHCRWFEALVLTQDRHFELGHGVTGLRAGSGVSWLLPRAGMALCLLRHIC